MSVKADLRFEGMDAFRQTLTTMARRMAETAEREIVEAANATAAEIKAAYPARTGNLRNGVGVRVRRQPLGVMATVANRAPHARIFELGTVARHTKIGANRGMMPPGHVFFPIYYRRRRELQGRLIDLLEAEGLKVIGDAA